MRFYNSYDETGEKTLVYVGLNEHGRAIVEYTCINNDGVLETNKGIVADRIGRGSRGGNESLEDEGWGWVID